MSRSKIFFVGGGTNSFLKDVKRAELTINKLVPFARKLRNNPRIGSVINPDEPLYWEWHIFVRGYGYFKWTYIWVEGLDEVECSSFVQVKTKDGNGRVEKLILAARISGMFVRAFLSAL